MTVNTADSLSGLVMENGVLSGIDYKSPLVRYRGERVVKLAETLAGKHLNLNYTVGADVFYAFYLPAPVLSNGAENTSSGLIISSILSSRTGILLRSKTVLDVIASYLAAAIVLSEYNRSDHQRSEREGQGESIPTDHVEKALVEAYKEIEMASKVRALANGLQPGTSSIYSVEDYSLDLLRLARETDIRDVIKYLDGLNYYDTVSTKSYRRSRRGEKLGYALGSDIERIVPRYLAYPPEVLYVKLAEGRLLLYEKGIPQSTSPLYVVIDKSGSMEGEKMLWAKAVALALYVKAVKGKRAFHARFFDSQPHQLVTIKPPFKPDWTLRAFEYIARIRSAGGTDITRALQTALSDLERERAKEATVVLITDGVDRVAERSIESRLRRMKVKLVTVMVKGDNQGLRKLSTAYLAVTKLSRSSVLRVIRIVE